MAQPRATAQNQIWTAPDLASLNFSGDCNLVNEFLHTWFNVDAGRLTNVPDHVADNATFWVPRSLSEIITDAYFRQALPQQERAIPTMGDILDWEYQQRVAYVKTVNSIASNSTNATFANTFPTYFDLVINDPANACPFVACGLSPQADQMADLNGPGINIFILFQSFILAVFGLISVYESIMRLSGHPKACLIRLCACIQRALPSFAMALTISDIALPVALIVYYLRARDAGQIFYKDFILTLWLSVSLLSSSLLVCRVGACLRQVARLPVACPFQNSPQAPPKSQCFRSQLFVDKPKAWLLLKVLNTVSILLLVSWPFIVRGTMRSPSSPVESFADGICRLHYAGDLRIIYIFTFSSVGYGGARFIFTFFRRVCCCHASRGAAPGQQVLEGPNSQVCIMCRSLIRRQQRHLSISAVLRVCDVILLTFASAVPLYFYERARFERLSGLGVSPIRDGWTLGQIVGVSATLPVIFDFVRSFQEVKCRL